MPSFDIVCEVNKVELKNALEQVNKEVSNRIRSFEIEAIRYFFVYLFERVLELNLINFANNIE